MVGKNISTILQRKLPPKCMDLDMFTIPYKIEKFRIRSAILDLGVSVNVMPKSIYIS